MAMAKRVFLFILTNILILLTLSFFLRLTGLDAYLQGMGGYTGLAIFCLVWGMGASLISLAMSRMMAKWMMGVKVIDPQRASSSEQWLVAKVHHLAKSAGLSTMPQVGIYPGQEINAFATGPSKNRSLVAVSEGLLRRMRPDEIEGVLAHEVAHVTNGDMVTMTLVQGVINAFVMFFARIVANIVAQALRGDEEGGPSWLVYFGLVIAFEIVFSILGAVVVNAFSRWREFRADAGGARLAGRGKMIGALEALRSSVEEPSEGSPAFSALKISSKGTGVMSKLFSTHPTLETRIKRLQEIA